MPGLNKKAAVELSISFIVIIIISLVVFAGSMLIVRKIFFGAQELQVQLDAQTQDEINYLLAGGEVVAIPLAQKTIQVGNQDVFWVAIANILPDTQTFNVLVGFDEGYYPNGSKMEYPDSPDQSYINENWLLYDSGPYEIAPGDNKPVSIMTIVKPDISTTLSTVRGFYAFNVCVLKDGALSDNPNLDATNCWYDENNWQYLYPSEDEQDGIERGRPRRFIVEVR